MLPPERFNGSFLQVASGKKQPFADGSLCRNAFRALVLLTGTRNPTKDKKILELKCLTLDLIQMSQQSPTIQVETPLFARVVPENAV